MLEREEEQSEKSEQGKGSPVENEGGCKEGNQSELEKEKNDSVEDTADETKTKKEKPVENVESDDVGEDKVICDESVVKENGANGENETNDAKGSELNLKAFTQPLQFRLLIF